MKICWVVARKIWSKSHEENGDPIGHFMADDYFYYAKGVASALATILEAVQEDFAVTVEARRGTDVLHHVVAKPAGAPSTLIRFISLTAIWTVFWPTTGPIWRHPSVMRGFIWGF